MFDIEVKEKECSILKREDILTRSDSHSGRSRSLLTLSYGGHISKHELKACLLFFMEKVPST